MSEFEQQEGSRMWDRQHWSLAVTNLMGIRIRVHVSLLIVLAAIAVWWMSSIGFALAALFLLAVAWHETGHYAAAYLLGGRVDEVVLWPVGGMTKVRLVRHRPIEAALIHLAAPAGNLLLVLLLFPPLHFLNGASWALWNPFTVSDVLALENTPALYLGLAFKTNYWLFLLNLLPLHPLDGGRALVELLTLRIPPFQANVVVSSIGIGGGLLMTGVALWWNNPWVSAAGALVAFSSFRRHRELEILGESGDNEFGYDFSEGYTSLERSMSHADAKPTRVGLGAIIKEWMRERHVKQRSFLEAELDRILAKIHESGLSSLSRSEKRLLARASRCKRR